MSGRAGRRGKDDKGIVILMVDENMSPAVGKNLVKGQADPLNSAFHLTYNMVSRGSVHVLMLVVAVMMVIGDFGCIMGKIERS